MSNNKIINLYVQSIIDNYSFLSNHAVYNAYVHNAYIHIYYFSEHMKLFIVHICIYIKLDVYIHPCIYIHVYIYMTI
jgi:hypothetical protein